MQMEKWNFAMLIIEPSLGILKEHPLFFERSPSLFHIQSILGPPNTIGMCQDNSSYAISIYAISTVAISTAHNFNLLQFRPELILANGS